MTFPTLPGPQGRWSWETSALYRFSSFSPPSASPYTNAFAVIPANNTIQYLQTHHPTKQTQIEIRFVYAYYQLVSLWSQLDCWTCPQTNRLDLQCMHERIPDQKMTKRENDMSSVAPVSLATAPGPSSHPKTGSQPDQIPQTNRSFCHKDLHVKASSRIQVTKYSSGSHGHVEALLCGLTSINKLLCTRCERPWDLSKIALLGLKVQKL